MVDDKKYFKLSDITAYKTAYSLSNYVWDAISGWDYFAKKTIGIQFVRAIDSISANIAEGFGRYFKKDKILFYRFSYGSIMESLDWNQKAKQRNLLTSEQYKHIYSELKKLPREMHHLIKFTDEKLSK